MAPKEIKRKRGRPPASSTPNPPSPSSRKSSSRIAAYNDKQSKRPASSPEPEIVRPTPRKRGRPPANSIYNEDVDAKRRRDRSPKRDGMENDTDEESGEAKIDPLGRLLGGREFKVPTFTLPDHGDEVLMLAMEPTKLLGYRDSYLFFHKHPSLKRVRITDEEKNLLVEMGMLVNWFKNRDVAVVTARSVFKCFGHKVIKRGRRIKDDYYEHDQEERSSAASTPISRRPDDLETADEDEDQENGARKSLIGKTARSEGYASKAPLTNETWMHHAALAARGFNAQLHERRVAKPVFYDIHSNINQVPSSSQSHVCCFEITSDNDSNQIVEFKKRPNKYNAPIHLGLGSELLDYDVQAAIEELSAEEGKEEAKIVFTPKTPIKIIQDGEDDNYPIALMEGQFQANFPLHQTRFNFPVPKIPNPTTIIDTAQSLAAQQHYLGLVYQSVNQYADPSRQPPVMGRLPQNFSPLAQATQLPQPPQSHPQPHPQQAIHPPQAPPPNMIRVPMNVHPAEPPVCGAVIGLNQSCRRPVNQPGEKCPVHQPPKKMSDFAKGPPPVMTYSDNKCAECHQLKAADSQFKEGEEHITDDFFVVKCSKCTRKYHPICANLSTPLQIAAVESYPWSCPECKICCVCQSAGDESTLMICDGCDRGWHTGCCTPKVDKVPEGSWLCQFCADCHSCSEHGMAEESQYTHATAPKSDRYKYPVYLATYCPKCNDHFKDDRFCPVCLKTYSEDEENDDEDNEMVACDTCDHWVHTRCDELLTPEKYQILCDEEEAKYTCPMCEDRFKPIVDSSTAELALKGLSAPSGVCIGLLGGKVKTRGVVKYKNIKVGVPEINGSGIADMPKK